MDMIKSIKGHWTVIVICVLVAFGLNRCAVACSRGQKLDAETEKYDKAVRHGDSLAHELDLSKEREQGLKGQLDISDRSAERISETKKNIQVTVRKIR